MTFVRYFIVGVLSLLFNTNAQTKILNFGTVDLKSPEAAVNHFIKSVAHNDLNGALQAFAIDEYAKNFDFSALATRLGAINIYEGLAPPEYSMYQQYNRINLLAKYTGQIIIFCYSFYIPEVLTGESRGTIIVNRDTELINDFINSVNPEQLSNLNIAKMVTIIPESETYLDIIKQQTAYLGADEAIEVLILYHLNGKHYAGGIHLLRYNEQWRIDALTSYVAGTPPSGNVTEITTEQFEALITNLKLREGLRFEEIN